MGWYEQNSKRGTDVEGLIRSPRLPLAYIGFELDMATNVLDDLATPIRHRAFTSTVVLVERTRPERTLLHSELEQNLGVGLELVVQLPR